LNLIDVEIAEFGYHKDDSEFFNSLHKDREITLNIRGHLNINTSLELLLSRGGIANFHEVNLLCCLSRFFLTEAENVVFVSDSIGNWDISKTTSISLKDLLLALLSEVELHPSIDVTLVIGIETD
jgi:hypothetical protein